MFRGLVPVLVSHLALVAAPLSAQTPTPGPPPAPAPQAAQAPAANTDEAPAFKIDLYRWDSSRDLGVVLQGSLGKAQRTSYALQLGNGSGSDISTLELLSAFAVVQVTPKVAVLGRLDRNFDEVPNGETTDHMPFSETARALFGYAGVDVSPLIR